MLSSRNPRDDEESSDLIELCSSCIAVSFIQFFHVFPQVLPEQLPCDGGAGHHSDGQLP